MKNSINIHEYIISTYKYNLWISPFLFLSYLEKSPLTDWCFGSKCQNTIHCCTIKPWYWSDLINYIWLQYIVIGISLVHSRGGVHSNSHVLIVGLCLVRGGLGRSFAVDVTWRDVTRPSWSMAGNHVLIYTNITSIHSTFSRSWYKHCYTLDPIIDDSCRLLICPGRSSYWSSWLEASFSSNMIFSQNEFLPNFPNSFGVGVRVFASFMTLQRWLKGLPDGAVLFISKDQWF